MQVGRTDVGVVPVRMRGIVGAVMMMVIEQQPCAEKIYRKADRGHDGRLAETRAPFWRGETGAAWIFHGSDGSAGAPWLSIHLCRCGLALTPCKRRKASSARHRD